MVHARRVRSPEQKCRQALVKGPCNGIIRGTMSPPIKEFGCDVLMRAVAALYERRIQELPAVIDSRYKENWR
jgi:hypothetical protein